jgi:hypothetical protein
MRLLRKLIQGIAAFLIAAVAVPLIIAMIVLVSAIFAALGPILLVVIMVIVFAVGIYEALNNKDPPGS